MSAKDFPRPGRRVTDSERASMLRVDQAGEFGATRIYAGQLAVVGDRHPDSRLIAGMAAQEERHRKHFDAMIARRGGRPTALQPIWNVAGFALGAVRHLERAGEHQLGAVGPQDLLTLL